MLNAREIGEYTVAHLANRVTFHGRPALEAALAECRNLRNDTSPVDGNAVIAAGNPGLTHDTVAEARTAMRAAILQTVETAIGVAPKNQVGAERFDRVHRLDGDIRRLADDVPVAEQSLIDASLDPLLHVAQVRSGRHGSAFHVHELGVWEILSDNVV